MRVDLLLVIEDLGVGLERGRYPLAYLNRSLLGRTLRGFPSAVATWATVRATICPLPGRGRLTGLSFNLRECGSNKFTIHLILLQRSKDGV